MYKDLCVGFGANGKLKKKKTPYNNCNSENRYEG
jgi:hypothetical protein